MNTNDSLAKKGFNAPEALKKVKVVTHNGPFHADDVFAVAFLKEAAFYLFDIVRSRDPEVLSTAEVLVDVGGEYKPEEGKFDHHFVGAPVRENGIPYASFGMVAKQTLGLSADLQQLIEKIDASDNGVKQQGWTLSKTVHKCNPLHADVFDCRFRSLVEIARQVIHGLLYLEHTLDFAVAQFESHPLVVDWVAEHEAELASSAIRIRSAFEQDGPVVALDRYEPALMETAADAPAEKLFSVYPSPSGEWMVQQIPLQQGSFAGRKQLPAEWAGKRGADLDIVTGVEGGVFAHPGRFIGGHKSKEGAVRLAQLAAAE
jgi:uncharacterized UPF0160 family protein